MWHVVVASMTTGILIAVYILVMGRLNVDRSVDDPVKEQATSIANQLLAISETHSSFGHITLCDTAIENRHGYGVEPHRTTSLNAAKASLHAAGVVANSLGSSSQEQQIVQDLNALDAVEKRLVQKMFEAVATPTENAPAAQSSIHAGVLKALQAKDPTDLKTVALTIRLGRYSDSKLQRTNALPESELGETFADNGFFKADFPVPVTKDRVVRFYPYANQVTVVEPNNFIEAAEGALPNAVLLEIKYEPRGSTNTRSVFKVRKLCALLGGTAPPVVPTCLLFRFPQGLPQSFSSPSQFLNKSKWISSGNWQQAWGGAVPGNGELKLTIDPVLPAMKPNDALAIGIYHWIRHLRPAPDPQAVLKALHQEIPLPQPKQLGDSETATAPVNSCLVADTGAREHSFAKTTGAHSESQKAIEQCFEYPGRLEEYPQSAMPLFVDRAGNLNLSGRKGFDADLIGRYLTAVYSTNLAALESMATAKLVRKQCAIENRELELKLSIKRQELAAWSRALSAQSIKSHATKSDDELVKIETQMRKSEQAIAELKSSCHAIDNRKEQLRYINDLARLVLQNGERCSARTYELCATTFTVLRNGLHTFDAPANGFLIGRKTIFLPIEDPVKELQFFEAASWAATDSQFDPGKVSPWFQKQRPVLVPAKDLGATIDATINSKSLNEAMSKVGLIDDMAPLTVLIDSRELRSPKNAQLHTASEYPFAGSPVSEDQAFYYAKSATTTGTAEDVVWSVVMRDLVFHELGRGRSIAGPANTSWERRFQPPLASTNALAVEFQLRRPLPRIEGMPAGAYITDPNKRLMTPQIPPVPVELM